MMHRIYEARTPTREWCGGELVAKTPCHKMADLWVSLGYRVFYYWDTDHK